MARYPNFDLDYADGKQGELFAADLRSALEGDRVQVKTDRGFIETGNIYVERACNYPGRGWTRTGIADPDASPLWIYVLRDTGLALVADIATLRRLADDSRFSRHAEERDGGHPTKGSVVRLRSVFHPGALR